MRNYLFSISFWLISPFFAYAQPQHPSSQYSGASLQLQLEGLIRGFHGEVGIYVKNLRSGETAAIQADSVFPTASMIKVPILIGVMDKIEKGELSYHQQLTYRDSLWRRQ